MEVALDPLTLPVRTRHDARAGIAQLAQRAAQLGAEALDLERLQHRRARDVEKRRGVFKGASWTTATTRPSSPEISVTQRLATEVRLEGFP